MLLLFYLHTAGLKISTDFHNNARKTFKHLYAHISLSIKSLYVSIFINTPTYVELALSCDIFQVVKHIVGGHVVCDHVVCGLCVCSWVHVCE